MVNALRAPLVRILVSTPPVAAVCTLACGHEYRHKVHQTCSSARHYCRQCAPGRPDDVLETPASESWVAAVDPAGDNVVVFPRQVNLDG